MIVNMTINSIDMSLVNAIKDLIKIRSPKATFTISELCQGETDNAEEERIAKIKSLCGGLSKYANPDLREKEKDAWGIAMKEKYAVR